MTSNVTDSQTHRQDGESLLIRSQIPIQFEGLERLNRSRHQLWRWFFRWVRLNFTMPYQEQTQWCWSAVSVSTSLYYNSSSTWTQCSLVNAELGQTSCCQTGDSSECNQPWFLDVALKRTGNLAKFVAGSVALSTIRSQINKKRLLGVRIGWSGGGGHFVLIEGYRTNTNFIAVEDPWYGSSDVDYSTFTTSYQDSGIWTHTYYTQSEEMK